MARCDSVARGVLVPGRCAVLKRSYCSPFVPASCTVQLTGPLPKSQPKPRVPRHRPARCCARHSVSASRVRTSPAASQPECAITTRRAPRTPACLNLSTLLLHCRSMSSPGFVQRFTTAKSRPRHLAAGSTSLSRARSLCHLGSTREFWATPI